jgi:NAD(P)-dependent dehydrogenase (short-subunit alcohol dehydrogenase family)
MPDSGEQGFGKIYNIAGFGEDGYTRKTMVPYGTTKRAVGYFFRGVAMELAGSGISLGWINPGMVITPLVVSRAREMGEKEWRKQGRMMFRLFGQRLHDCGEILVGKMIADRKNGTFVKLLPGYKILLGFCFNWLKKDQLLEFGI